MDVMQQMRGVGAGDTVTVARGFELQWFYILGRQTR